MTAAVHQAQPPEPVIWPRWWPPLVGLFPFLVMALLVLWPAARQGINEHWVWTAILGAMVLPLWLGVFGGLAAHGLDFWLRTFDFVLNRTYGPDVRTYPLGSRIRLLLTRGGLLNGYSLPIVFWTVLVLLIVVFGPTRTPL